MMLYESVLKNKNLKSLQAQKLNGTETKGYRGIISVEAAIIIPIVIMIYVQLISILQMLSVYSGFLVQISQIGEEVSLYSYFGDWSDIQEEDESNILDYTVKPLLFSELYLKTRVNAAVAGEGLAQVVDGGALGVSYLGSYCNLDKNEIYIRATYEGRTMLEFVPVSIDFQAFYYSKLWRGYQVKEISDSEEVQGSYVYVTETGSKYHLTSSCTYLDYDITAVDYDELTNATTHTGAAYSACLVCKPKLEDTGSYFITMQGDRYHDSLLCPSLKRTVERIKIENVGDRTLCSRCEKRND